MPLQATSGAASYDAFGGGAPAGGAVNYIEDVFSTWLYTGTGASQTITNNIDLSTKGGLVWIKSRSDATDHRLTDTVRGATKSLASNLTAAEITESTGLTAFGTTGFTIGADADYNTNAATYASWTFREQEKFFDIVTYTGNGVAGRTIAHNLGSVPGCIIVKCTSASAIWSVYHRSTGATDVGILDGTNAFSAASAYWNNTAPTSSVFTVGAAGAVNDSGQTFVAYIFAHDAGGFGLTGTDNVISCGSYTGNGSATGPTITLGYEPQWIMIKKSSAISGSESWAIWDNIRNSGLWDDWLIANGSQAEQVNNANVAVQITSTGFFPNATNNTANSYVNTSGSTYIYIAIRRGPMKVPTVGTSVFSPSTASQNSGVIVSGFPVDASILASNSLAGFNSELYSRLSGGGYYLKTSATDAQAYSGVPTMFQYNNGISPARFDPLCLTLMFQRAPSFMDVVCYTGNSVQGRTITHNLGVKPELMIVKSRSNTPAWYVYNAVNTATQYMLIDSSQSSNAASFPWNDTEPTSSVFTVQGTGGSGLEVNWTGYTYIAYLFATCAGVSKVGSYTGTGALLTVNCGFTSGARYVLIKRTDSTGGWYSYNSASGISSGTDPYLLLNSSAVEVTGTNYVDTTSTGFQVTAAAPAGLNASGGSYIFLAIA